MKVIESVSAWDIKDLLRKTAGQIAKDTKVEYTDPASVFERHLIRFLERLPNGNYDEFIAKWRNS